jgi:uncharacterized protein YjlB
MPHQPKKLDATTSTPREVLSAVLPEDGTFPNNALPILLYKQAIQAQGRDPASTFEQTFEANGWGGIWRNGIYDYHHYHATAHEVLGIARGTVKVHLGGPNGKVFDLEAGDVVVLPAGVSHKNVGASDDLLVVGAYPAGQEPDMNYGRPRERPSADENIAGVPRPEADPVFGRGGPLSAHWRSEVR